MAHHIRFERLFNRAVRLVGPDVGYVTPSHVRMILDELHQTHHAISGAARLMRLRPDLEPFIQQCLPDIVADVDRAIVDGVCAALRIGGAS